MLIIIQASQPFLTLDKIMASAVEEMIFPKLLNGGTSINDFYFELSEAELSLVFTPFILRATVSY